MAKSIKDHLQDIFDDLGKDNQKRFKSKLCDRKTEPRVRRATVEKVQDSLDLADLMVNTFTTDGSVPVTIEILQAIGCNEQAVELKENTGQLSSQSDHRLVSISFRALHRQESGKADKPSVDAILDQLLDKKVITEEVYSNIRAEKTPRIKMRELLMGPVKSAGTKGKDAL
ncbi:apoptosis-associated speck-like protein containing a CARD [Carassius gibelio]|uniref:apoptosis-associated speck-like protein containing a CARD n=1 Tax=Carassius gibelio TaxID=101364 RepID=UPI00227877BB|nr:apoptosis-associated speck-like protein containing a CARD [Carassius gibelio]